LSKLDGAPSAAPPGRDHPHRNTLRWLQRRLEHFYGLERAPDVLDFVRIGDNDSRETLLLRERGGELEIALVLPTTATESPSPSAGDVWLQLVEGVSHFVYIAERARTGLPATRLELELQAEVDKFVLLTLRRRPVQTSRCRTLLDQLYARVRFLDPPGSEAHDRYRLANDLAARFVARLLGHGRWNKVERELRRFYRSGQAEKIRLASAA
jgi:hypothetical protein